VISSRQAAHSQHIATDARPAEEGVLYGQPAINSYSFGYDVINRLTSMSSKDGPSTFTYDSTSQLTSERRRPARG
jgi:YD repeat-containing protein